MILKLKEEGLCVMATERGRDHHDSVTARGGAPCDEVTEKVKFHERKSMSTKAIHASQDLEGQRPRDMEASKPIERAKDHEP